MTVSNYDLYNLALFPRIYSLIIQLTRDYYEQASKIDNKLIKKFCDIHVNECIFKANSGYMSPQMFTYFDKKGLIQDGTNIPLLTSQKQ